MFASDAATSNARTYGEYQAKLYGEETPRTNADYSSGGEDTEREAMERAEVERAHWEDELQESRRYGWL